MNGDGKQSIQVDLEFLANFVHQVVNPLNGIAGTLDNLVDGTIKEESKRKQRLRATRAQLEQCIALMHNLAYLAQGFSKLKKTDEDVAVLPKIIIDSAMFYQEDGRSRGVKIELLDPETQNKVTGHIGLVKQVIMNMLDNCVKYSADETTVLVDQRIQKHTSNAVISIKNTLAHPMAAGDLQRIFDRGFRGQNARQSVASGTGLGLHICKQIVEDVHGGALTVQQHGKAELEFLIKLPRGTSP